MFGTVSRSNNNPLRIDERNWTRRSASGNLADCSSVTAISVREKRNNYNYSTIIVVVSSRLTLRNSRETEPLVKRLTEPPGVEIVSRDRTGNYALSPTETLF